MIRKIDAFIGQLMSVLVVIYADRIDDFRNGRVRVDRIRRKGHKTIYRIVENRPND